MTRLFLLLALLWAPLAHAQVNIEKLRTETTEDGLSGSISLATAFSTGNVDFADFGLGSFLEVKRGDHVVFWVTNGRFAAKRSQADYLEDPKTTLWDKGAHFSNSGLSHLRYNYTLSDRVAWEAYGQIEYNEFLLLDQRLVGGTGPRLEVCTGFWLGTSAMFESERLSDESLVGSEEANTAHIRSSTYATTRWDFSETNSWLTTVYYQPRFDMFSDFRLVGETGLVFAIDERFSFSVDARIRHDSLPPQTQEGIADIQATDIGVKNAISVNW